MPVVTITDTSLVEPLDQSTKAVNAVKAIYPLLEPLSPPARAWVLRKLAERLCGK